MTKKGVMVSRARSNAKVIKQGLKKFRQVTRWLPARVATDKKSIVIDDNMIYSERDRYMKNNHDCVIRQNGRGQLALFVEIK